MKPRNIRDSYKLYKEEAEYPVIDIKSYINIAAEYNKFLMNKIFEGEIVTLPARLGTLGILGKKQKITYDENGNIKGLAPDWVKTKKLWDSNPEAKAKKQLMYHINEHSSYIRYKFFWSKNRVLVSNKTLYSLRISRDNKREINKRVVSGQEFKTI